ncbi:ABC transporter permease [Litorilinea aerophila]|uniref:ABC transporter permease n=1 Tax=Litorilinea aerophila TaxID=1204385 RepID=A0A540VHJ9_9CHLR|nr:ABC transporter permease [Litorilinea aerophila]MCC9076288.1 ABC transporter permease [Litorilinea aerophila]OUC07574.1 ABC transporter permease [Litorilinea aerophila]GIV80030.1 MAG: ABC transporter permease [Litorilinea sp.]
MTRYMVQRSIYLLFLLWMVTIVTFVVIQLPPGDYLSTYISRLEQQAGDVITEEMIQALKAQYGLDLPMHERYLKWLGSVFRGDFGFSYEWQKPVGELIRERLALSFTVAILSTLVTYAIAIPIGIYSATHQYSLGDYVITVWGFLGLAIPNFMLALVFLFLAFKLFGANLSGLFSPEYIDAPWSTAKVIDMLKHLPIPILVLSTSGAAGLIRVLRATLLDELQKQYVITARAKGVSETRLLFKYPVRVALNPLISNLAWLFPALISGGTIVDIVLGLPTAGPMLFRALISQDTFLSASILLFMSILTVIGTTVSDILLVVVDPRIRMEKGTE